MRNPKGESDWRPLRPVFDRRPRLDRDSPETITRSCGNQPAYQSLINRRLMVSPPAMRDSLEPSSNPRCWGRTMLPTQLENGHQKEADIATLASPSPVIMTKGIRIGGLQIRVPVQLDAY